MHKGAQHYSGKAKTLYATDDADYFIVEFRDDATAFNGEKHELLAGKGQINNLFNAFIMQQLAQAEIATHFQRVLTPTTSLVQRLTMIPVECVIRNLAAGSICRRLGVPEGQEFSLPIFEFFYKNDSLGDPLINTSHIQTFGFASAAEVAAMQQLTLQINRVLSPLFAAADLILVDFKVEFGRRDGQLILGDEFSPDGCRVWDAVTREKLDKDRFRQNLGNVIASYEQIAQRLGIPLSA